MPTTWKPAAMSDRSPSGDSSSISFVDEIDISGDPELIDRYGLEIPVLLIDGKKAAKYRVSEEELRRMLDGRRGVRES